MLVAAAKNRERPCSWIVVLGTIHAFGGYSSPRARNKEYFIEMLENFIG